MRIVIRNRWTGDEIYAADADSLRAVVVQCVRELGIGLTDADLRGAVLTDADLRGADLTDAVLRGADLTGADLTGAVLAGAVLTGAVLRGADLTGAVLRGADLTGAVLRGADLTGADLTDADLTGADLRGAVLTGADLTDADLRGADLRGADLTGAVLTDAAVLTEVTIACLLARATRLDGYEFRLFALDSGTHLIIAGCRRLTVEQYRAHVAAEYPGSAKASETFDILDFFAARIAHHQPQATTPA